MNKRKQKKKFKILLLNLGYCCGFNGSLFQYLVRFYRYLYLSKKIESEILSKLKKIISKEKPDLICLIEIKQGNQIKSLINSEYPFYDIETKYGKNSILRNLPFFYNKSNCFISKSRLKFKKHFLKNGTKKLAYEIFLPKNISLVMTHFSLNKKVRQQQFKEISRILSIAKKKIVCGDFNIFGGLDEIKTLLTHSNLTLAHKEPTFPAFKPKKALDLFLCSKNIKTESKVLKEQLSDHLPVILKICP